MTSTTTLRDLFVSILSVYSDEKTKYNRELINRVEQKKLLQLAADDVLSQVDYVTPSLLRSTLPNEIRRLGYLNRDFFIRGNAGSGYMPDVPFVYISLSSITKSSEEGYYIVFLFDSEREKVFLSLNQGFKVYRNEYGNKVGRIRIQNKAALALRLLKSVNAFKTGTLDLPFRTDLARGYSVGNICHQEYDLASFPGDSVILNDLRDLIGIYRELYGIVGTDLFNADDVVVVNTTGSEDEDEFQQGIQLPGEGKRKLRIPTSGPVPKKKPTTPQERTTGNTPERDRDIAAYAIEVANYECQVKKSHFAFKSKFGHPFVEAHHFIPMEFADWFENSIDVPENILSLCPNCHRMFHHSEDSEKKKLILEFYGRLKDGLVNRDIHVPVEDVIDMYLSPNKK